MIKGPSVTADLRGRAEVPIDEQQKSALIAAFTTIVRQCQTPGVDAQRVAMAFGRDVRGALFHRVTDFSAQDVASFGAPSLITRITNDVTQVQVLVLMSCTLLVAVTCSSGH